MEKIVVSDRVYWFIGFAIKAVFSILILLLFIWVGLVGFTVYYLVTHLYI